MHYFAYGANMHPRQMGATSPAARVLGIGRLEGFRLAFTVYSERWEGGAANIEPDDGAHVWGVVWEVPDEDIPKLDTFAGHPTFYRQERATVGMGREEIPCLTYRVAHIGGFVKPSDPYLHLLRAAIRLQGLPPQALDILEQAAALPYPRID